MKNYELKASYKMRMAISRLEKKFGKLQKRMALKYTRPIEWGRGSTIIANFEAIFFKV